MWKLYLFINKALKFNMGEKATVVLSITKQSLQLLTGRSVKATPEKRRNSLVQ